jgi:hypothetical protein
MAEDLRLYSGRQEKAGRRTDIEVSGTVLHAKDIPEADEAIS